MGYTKIIQYVHRPNMTELGIGNTHETYMLVESKTDLSEIFPPSQEVFVTDPQTQKGYSLKSVKGTEFRVNQMGAIYRDYGVKPGDEIIITHFEINGEIKNTLTVHLYNRIELSVNGNGTEIVNIERLDPYSIGERKFSIPLNDAGIDKNLFIAYQESRKKRSDSPSETDYYSVKLDNVQLNNGKYYINIADTITLIDKLPKSEFNKIIIDEAPSVSTNIEEISNRQVIYYGAPGTGKSYEINRLTQGKEVIRTTFHPDSDYSTFVGAYKPTSIEVPVRDVTGKVIVENGKQVTENRIVYEFVEQAFLQAYINAWKAYANAEAGEKPTEQYLVIEEINRGNCAQIFGDLFQLLDRNYAGFSDYPITADKDMKKQLAKAFKDLTIADAERINAIYDKDIVAQVLKGDVLLLPDNLYIWATMNTSDQSLFPIDSAFKRRWDWKYIPISEGKDETGNKLNYMIKVRGKLYSWWDFVEKINNEIGEQTKSEDKKLGYFFCKARNGIIDAETFVSKVVFYLWNDVFKDQDLGTLFIDENGDDLTFSRFYKVDDFGKPMVKVDKVEIFLRNLGVEEVDEMAYNSEEEEVISDTESGSRRILHVEFDDEDIAIKRFPQYLQVLKKIGLDRAEIVASEKQTQVLGCALIAKEPEDAIENSNEYTYVESEGYYVVKGIKGKVMLDFLPMVSDRYHLNLKIEYR